jgi:hypothetical protein
MRRAIWLVTCVMVALTGHASADDADDDEAVAPRWSASLEVAMMFSPADGARQDVGGWSAIVPRHRWTVRPGLALTVGIAVPIPPLIAFHAPIGVEWAPRGARRGPVLRAHARPLWTRVDLCGNGGDCPMDAAADPYDRGASMFGGAMDVGASYRVGGDAWTFEVAAAYAIGRFDGRAAMVETAIDGTYQGFTIELGLLH